jgi:hypothetical protein
MPVEHIPTQMYHLYRTTRLCRALIEALEDLVVTGDITNAAAYGVLQQYDHSVLKAIRRPKEKSKIRYQIVCDKMVAFKRCFVTPDVLQCCSDKCGSPCNKLAHYARAVQLPDINDGLIMWNFVLRDAICLLKQFV